MAIDPLMYERLSGKTGDPNARRGAALAKDVQTKANQQDLARRAVKSYIWGIQYQWFMALLFLAIIGLVALAVLLSRVL